MKILFLTDTHIRGTSPINRKDDFLATLEKKLSEVMEIIKNEKVDYCLHGGDMFDRPDIAPSIVREIGIILRKCPVPIYAIAGNHDIYGYNPTTLPRTMLGLLDGFGAIRLLEIGEKIILEKDGVRVQLTGQHFSYNLDQQNPEGYVIEKRADVHYAIHLVHGLLLEKPLFPGVAYTLIENILQTEADITLVGHYHRGFAKVLQIEGKYFVNPGSLMRLEASTGEMKRIPQVALLEIQKEGIRIKLQKLKTALLGNEVLDATKLLSQEYKEKKMADFIQGIKEVGQFKAFNVQEIIEMVADKAGIQQEIRKEALERIAKAQEIMAVNGKIMR